MIVSVDTNEITCSLLYLSSITKIDYKILLLLYEKFGKDVLYVFYLLQGLSINFPSDSSLNACFGRGAKYLKGLKEDHPFPEEDKEFLFYLNNFKMLYNSKHDCFQFTLGVKGDNGDES